MSDAIRVNGNSYDWGSIVCKVDGDVFHGFTGITYGQRRERAKTYGTGKHRRPRGRTRGKYSAEAKITGYLSSMQLLRDKLASLSPNGISYGDVEFQIVVQFIEADEYPVTVEIVDCVITAEDDAFQETSNDGLVEDVGIDCMYIKKNGKTLFDDADGTA